MKYEGYANAECPIAIRQLPKQLSFFILANVDGAFDTNLNKCPISKATIYCIRYIQSETMPSIQT